MKVHERNGHGNGRTVSNGLNGEAAHPTGRDAGGRFARGCAPGPGNPFNRKLAAMREQLVELVGTPGLERLVNALLRNAEKGDLASAKVLLTYVVGKPVAAVHPDNLDADELARVQQGAGVAALLDVATVNPAAGVALTRQLQRVALMLAVSSPAGQLVGPDTWEKVFAELNDRELSEWFAEQRADREEMP
jgi:hypothetical protein